LPRPNTLDLSNLPQAHSLVHREPEKFRAECLNANWFLSLDEARQKCEAWRRDLYVGFRGKRLGHPISVVVEFIGLSIARRHPCASRRIHLYPVEASASDHDLVHDLGDAARGDPTTTRRYRAITTPVYSAPSTTAEPPKLE
jgi:hypothetical protein